MSDTLSIPARIDGSVSVRLGETYTVMGQRLIVTGDVLTVYETRQFTGFHQDQVVVGRYKLTPLP